MNNVYISVVLSIDGTDIDIAINVISGSASPKLGLLTTDRLTERAANDMANVFSFLDSGLSLYSSSSLTPSHTHCRSSVPSHLQPGPASPPGHFWSFFFNFSERSPFGVTVSWPPKEGRFKANQIMIPTFNYVPTKLTTSLKQVVRPPKNSQFRW